MKKFRDFEECNYLKSDEERVLFLELLNANKKTPAPALKSVKN